MLGAYLSHHRVPQFSQEFNPRMFGAVALWLDAELGINQSGGTVGGWSDQSGQGNHCNQGSVPNQPAYNTSPINGRPSLRFNGTNSRLVCVNNPTLSTTTVFCALSVVSAAASGTVIAGNSVAVYQNLLAGQANWAGFYGVGVASGTTLSLATTYVLGMVVRNFNDIDFWTNGAIANKTTGTAFTPRSGLSIGADPSGSTTNPANIDLSEVIIYSSALPPADVRTVNRYLCAKYGVPA